MKKRDSLWMLSFLYLLHANCQRDRKRRVCLLSTLRRGLKQLLESVHFGAKSHIHYQQLSSNPDLGYEAQLRAVSSAHIVIITHGAFQANMLFMQNRALLVELFGNIHHLPTHVFHRLALSFQLFYGRVHASSFKSMYQPSFNMSTSEIQSVVSVVRQYFDGGHWKSLKK